MADSQGPGETMTGKGGEDTLCIRYPYPSMPFNRATVLVHIPAKLNSKTKLSTISY